MTVQEYNEFNDKLTPWEREQWKLLKQIRDLLDEIAQVGRD